MSKIGCFFLLASTTGRTPPSFSGVTRRALHTKEQWRALSPLLQTTRDVGNLLSSAHAAEKRKNRQCLITYVSSLKAYVFLLGKVSLFMGPGDLDESGGNFTQLLRLRAVAQPHLLTWLEHKTDKYTSPQVQNEISQLWLPLLFEHQRNYSKGSLLLYYG